jgi:hypothetical protein
MPAIKAKKATTLKCILMRPAIFKTDTTIWLTGATISNKSGINLVSINFNINTDFGER